MILLDFMFFDLMPELIQLDFELTNATVFVVVEQVVGLKLGHDAATRHNSLL